MILVTGATGNVGSELVSQLLDRNQQVRVLTRDPRKVAQWGDRVECAVGSFDEPATLDAALKGVDKMFLMTSEIGSGQVEAAIKAARQAGVQHVVYLSSTGANHPDLLLGKWHQDREAAIRASGVAWTFLRPGNFMSNTLMWAETVKTQGAVYFPGGGQSAPIDPEDIAAVAAVALTQAGHEGQIYELTGEELLTVAQQTEILSHVLGKPLRYVDVPPAVAREGMLQRGMPPILADAVAQVFTYVRDGRGAQATDTVERVVGRKPRTFEAWCRDHVAAFQ
ncbi:MAG TPA: SDR family oxidoreductase [Chthonomonadaceae bacterium]|nr:SDR family oxidoreductase [Chthonomonadaceae bacterium]